MIPKNIWEKKGVKPFVKHRHQDKKVSLIASINENRWLTAIRIVYDSVKGEDFVNFLLEVMEKLGVEGASRIMFVINVIF